MGNRTIKTYHLSTSEDYDPHSKADMVEAQKHRQAHYIHQIGKNTSVNYSEKCKCCGFPVEAIPFPLNCSIMELAELGSGFPLYFVLATGVALTLILGAIITGIGCAVETRKVMQRMIGL